MAGVGKGETGSNTVPTVYSGDCGSPNGVVPMDGLDKSSVPGLMEGLREGRIQEDICVSG